MRLIDADKLPVVNTIERIKNNDVFLANWIPAESIENAPTVDAIPTDYMLTKAQEWLIDRTITGSEMKFLRDLIKEWEADENKYLDFKSSLNNWEEENGPIEGPSIVPYEIQELDPFK